MLAFPAKVALGCGFGEEKTLLALIFAFAEALEDGESGFFGIADRQGLELEGRAEVGEDLADRLFAGRALGQCRRAERSAQGEVAATSGASSVAKFVFVERHFRMDNRC